MNRILVLAACAVVCTATARLSLYAQPEPSRSSAPLNINNHFIRVSDVASAGWNAGFQERHSFPVRGATIVYVDNLLAGGYLKDAGSRRLWVSGHSYNSGMVPGPIARAGDPATTIPNRVYRIRKDYRTADLRQDAADVFGKPIGQVTSDDIDAVRARYAQDWQEWPVSYGAPFYDVNGNGLRDQGEEPGLLDADMVVWCVANDSASASLYACPPVGVEVQGTWWGYKGAKHALGNSIFERYKCIFRGPGIGSSTAYLESLYVTKFVDPDLGASGDDLLGCDTVLQLGYVYNGRSDDPGLTEAGIVVPPSLGYAILEGTSSQPLGGRVAHAMSSFWVKASGVGYSDPPFTAEGSTRMYRWMRGYYPDPSTAPWRIGHNALGEPSFFLCTGDPWTLTGDIDGQGTLYSLPPGDRRFLMSIGPATLHMGDSLEVTYAIVGAAGGDRLRNVDYLKWLTSFVRDAYPDVASLRTFEDGEPDPDAPLPANVSIWSPYPNPFNPSTTIMYAIPSPMNVRLEVFDILGRMVNLLVDQVKDPGTYQAEWNGTDQQGSVVASGIYLVRLIAGGRVAVRKMLLQR